MFPREATGKELLDTTIRYIKNPELCAEKVANKKNDTQILGAASPYLAIYIHIHTHMYIYLCVKL